MATALLNFSTKLCLLLLQICIYTRPVLVLALVKPFSPVIYGILFAILEAVWSLHILQLRKCLKPSLKCTTTFSQLFFFSFSTTYIDHRTFSIYSCVLILVWWQYDKKSWITVRTVKWKILANSRISAYLFTLCATCILWMQFFPNGISPCCNGLKTCYIT